MICAYCGKEVPDDAAYCPYCAKAVRSEPIKERDDNSALIEKAKSGDQQAISLLYEQTYSKAFYTVKSMIKDEDAVFDVLQDTYVKAFSHLDSFEGGEKFTPWVKQIAANTARDWLKKKRPLLFSELRAGEDVDVPVEELFEDERSEHIPEQVLDQEETKRLIREIIEELPEDQRAAIGMYYYEDMSVREIAAAMDATENAVKSRLLYGRRKIEKKVRELEKKGTKLYGLAPIPFLLLLFRSQKAYAAEGPSTAILQNVLGKTAAQTAAAGGRAAQAAQTVGSQSAKAAGAAKTAGAAHLAGSAGAASTETAAAAGGFGAAKLALLIAASVIVIGGGAVGIGHARSAARETPAIPEPPAITAEAVTADAPVIVETTPKPEPTGTLVPTATPAPTPTPVPTATPEPEEEPEPDFVAEMPAVYRPVLDRAASYDYGPDAPEEGAYRCALVYLDGFDSVPALLLSRQTGDHAYRIRLFQYDTETETMLEPSSILEQNSWGIGAYGMYLHTMESGGLFLSTNASGNGRYYYIERLTLEGQEIAAVREWEGGINDPIPMSLTPKEIEWYDLSEPGGEEMANAAESGDEGLAAWTAAEEASGRIVLTGTIDTYSYNEVIELQGYPDPNAEYSDKSWTYRIIVLDTPQVLAGHQAGDDVEYETSMICVQYPFSKDPGIPADLDGRDIVFSLSEENLYWPGGTDLPLGMARTSDVHVMNESGS